MALLLLFEFGPKSENRDLPDRGLRLKLV